MSQSKLSDLFEQERTQRAVQSLDDRQFERLFGFKPPARGTTDVRDFIEHIAKQKPELWKYFYPRWYRNTDQYLSAKLPAQTMFMVALDVLGITHTQPSLTETAMFTTSLKLHEYRFPHFYVAPALFQAVSLSLPPPELRWDELELPFEAAIFMLPRKTLYHPVNGEVAWVAYRRLREGDQLDFHIGPHEWHRQSANTGFVVVWECHEHRPNPPAFHTTLINTVNPYISTADIAACFDEKKGAVVNDGTWLSIPLVEGEEKFSELITSLVFRLLLAMDAKPQIITRGKFTGKRLSSGHQPEIWDPNFVGKDYVLRRSASGTGTGGGWSVRLHWKRGHYKQQPHGPQAKQRKTIWIEPYLAGIE